MIHFRSVLLLGENSAHPKYQIIPRENLKSFLKAEGGSTTAEFVLWVPIFMLILILTADVSMALFRYSNIYYVARHSARQVAVNQWSISEAISYATERTTFSGVKPEISVGPSLDLLSVIVAIKVPVNTIGVYPNITISKDTKLFAIATENYERM